MQARFLGYWNFYVTTKKSSLTSPSPWDDVNFFANATKEFLSSFLEEQPIQEETSQFLELMEKPIIL